mmetsp:Transcript_2383/g.5667  ORF Transcript_2383/g.5667 Transcript_2383/m.5667 type:complete len:234 (-) Transcript_2383:769-1470(-)
MASISLLTTSLLSCSFSCFTAAAVAAARSCCFLFIMTILSASSISSSSSSRRSGVRLLDQPLIPSSGSWTGGWTGVAIFTCPRSGTIGFGGARSLLEALLKRDPRGFVETGSQTLGRLMPGFLKICSRKGLSFAALSPLESRRCFPEEGGVAASFAEGLDSFSPAACFSAFLSLGLLSFPSFAFPVFCFSSRARFLSLRLVRASASNSSTDSRGLPAWRIQVSPSFQTSFSFS